MQGPHPLPAGRARRRGRERFLALARGLALATLLAGAAAAQETLGELAERARALGPELGLPELERALAAADAADPDFVWALLVQADLLLSAERHEGVFALCERARVHNDARIAALAARGDGDGELEARLMALQIQAQEARLWRSLGLFERLGEAVAAERALLEAVRALAREPELLQEAEFTLAVDTCTLYLGQERSAAALETCSELRARGPLPAEARRFLDLYEAHAWHDLALEGTFDAARARERLESLAADPLAPAGLAHAALLLEVELDLAAGAWDAARATLERVRALEQRADASAPSRESRARVLALQARLQLGAKAGRSELARCRDELASALDQALAGWRALAPPPAGLGIFHWGSQRMSVSALIDLELALEPGEAGRERALEVLLRAQSVGTLARRLGYAPLDAAALRHALCAEGQGCLVWFPSTDRTHLFLLDAAGVGHETLASWDRLQELVDPWLETALDPPAGGPGSPAQRERLAEFERLGRLAREELLPARVRARLAGWGGIYVVGVQTLRQLPFELLPLEDGTPCGVRWAVAQLPSLPVGACLAARAEAPGERVVLLADPEPSAAVLRDWSTVGPLALGRDEADALCAGRGGARFLGARAALSDELRAALADASALVVFAHGVYDERRERPPLLVLSPLQGSSGLVGCEDLETLGRLPVLVELITCGSGRGRTRFGDDSDGQLAAALFLRGAQCVLQTRRDVPRHATLALMSAANARILGAGATPAEGLRAAREELWRRAETRDPYAIGHVQVSGLGFRRATSGAAATSAPRGGAGSGAGRVVLGLVLVALALGLAFLALRARRNAAERGLAARRHQPP